MWSGSAELLLLLTVFLLPFQTRWIFHVAERAGYAWEFGTRSFYIVDGLIVLAFLLTLLQWSPEKSARLKKYGLLFSSASLVLLASYLSFLFADNKSISGWWLWNVLLSIAFCFTLVMARVSWTRLAWTVVAAMTLQAILAMAQWKLQAVLGNTWLGIAEQFPENRGVQVVSTLPYGRVLRPYGALPHPNILAGYVTIGIWFATSLLEQVSRRSFKKREVQLALTLLLGMSLALQASTLWMTMSRSALLALGITLIGVVLWHAIERQRLSQAMVISVCSIALPILILTWMFSWYVTPRAEGLLATETAPTLEQLSIEQRVSSMNHVFSAIEKKPLSGVGIGNATLKQAEPVHNVLLLIFHEIGIFGLMSVALFGVSLAALLWNQWHESTHNRLMITTAGLILATLFIIGLFDHYLWSLHAGSLLLWLCISSGFLAVDENA